MQRKLIDTLIKSAANTPGLLAPVSVNRSAEKSIAAIVLALEHLGKDHPIVKHLKEFSATTVTITSTEKEGKIVPNTNNALGLYRYALNRGVYSYTHLLTGKQYFGSSIHFFNRIRVHMHQFAGRRAQGLLHKWVEANGGTPSLVWGTVYEYPNFMWSFIKRNPNHKLSLGEYKLLLGISQLITRLLEQSILDKYWNQEESLNASPNVTYTYAAFFEVDFSNYDYDDPMHKKVEVWDAETSQFIGEFSSIAGAARFLGVAVRALSRCLNNSKGTVPQKWGRRIIISQAGVPLTDEPIHYRVKSYPELTLANMLLTDLPPKWLYVFYPDKSDYLGPFASISEARKYLNPEKSKGLTNPQIKTTSTNFMKAVNKENLVKTELGSFYLAKHPTGGSWTNLPKNVIRPAFKAIKAS